MVSGIFMAASGCNKSARADRCILFRSMRQAAAILLFLAAVPPLGAREIVFDTWTVRDGLPQGSIYDIIQTRDGYIWLATLGGLVRFDGIRFTVFERAGAPGITSNRFMTLFEDRE